jgi:hypothetical protein
VSALPPLPPDCRDWVLTSLLTGAGVVVGWVMRHLFGPRDKKK